MAEKKVLTQSGTAEAQALARQYHCKFVDLKHFHIDPALFRSVPLELMFRHQFIPLESQNGRLVIATSKPEALARVDEIEWQMDRRLEVKIASSDQIAAILHKSSPSQRVLEEVTEEFRLDLIREEEDGGEVVAEKNLDDPGTNPLIRLVNSFIFAALERRASDIHIEGQESAMRVKFRIDGVLQLAMQPIDKAFQSSVISRIKVMSELDIAERRVPQDGRFRVRYGGRPIDFRVSIMPSTHGEDAVLRILDKQTLGEKFHQLRLDVLGFTDHDLRRLRRFISEPYGMVLVTGPTGSGKTTTLYAALSEIKTEEDKIITIEDPVEYQVPGITQIPVNEKKGLTFARGLRSILRHDPDKIMVGEIRDSETAHVAIQSALTGHLVFTTVHANNVIDVLGRFLNMGVEAYNFVSALNCILAQRLVRIICNGCRRPTELTPTMREESSLDPAEWAGVTLYQGSGCLECNGTGFRGRTAISELLDLSENIRELILARRSASEIYRAARNEGLVTLRADALGKVRAGITTLREVNKVTFVE